MIKKILKQELDKNIPDVINRIKFKLNIPSQKNREKTFRPHKFLSYFAIATCFVVLMVFGFVSPFMNESILNQYNLTISINPSVTLKVKDGIVINQVPLNMDGQKLLYKENLIGMTERSATRYIIKLADSYGYIKPDASIRLWVSDSPKGSKNQITYENVFVDFKKIILENNLNGVNIISFDPSEINELIDNFDEELFIENSEIIHNKFVENLKSLLELKITDISELIEFLKPYNIDSQEKLNETCKNKLLEYSVKYKCKIEDLNKIKYEDIEEIIDDLTEKKEELSEIQNNIINGADEDDFKNAIEDLMDMVKELINKEK